MIAPRFHSYGLACSLDDDHILHRWAAFDGIVHDVFEFNDLAILIRAIAGDDQFRLAVINAALQ
jgi:hypothetical protein